MKRTVLLLLVFFAVTGIGRAQRVSQEAFKPWQSLIGKWRAANKGVPGAGTATFSFEFDLQRRVIIHRSHTNFPATKSRAAFAHDTLMIIYMDEPSQRFKADYYDNEGRVVHYAAEFSKDGRACTLVSEAAAGQPRFRLTISLVRDGNAALKLEMAPPNDSENFAAFMEANAQRIRVNR